MTNGQRVPPNEIETGRLQTVSDSIFAFALTLLGTSLQVPDLGGEVSAAALLRALSSHWPSYAGLVLSFATVVIMWLNHHTIFGLVRTSDASLLVANGILLLLVVVVPLPTELVTEYLGTPAASAAVAIYAGTFLTITLAYNLLWFTVAYRGRLLKPAAPATYVKALTRNYLIGVPLYLLATALAFWNAYASLGICALLWVFWALTSRGRPRLETVLPTS